MLLHNVAIVGKEAITDIGIQNGKINAIDLSISALPDEQTFYFDNAIAFPGLINSHDHLEFNLFPQLGNKKYNNYVEWGTDIHLNNKPLIDNVLKIPKSLRAEWGIYKNLINGVTTVVNHGDRLHLKE